MSPKAAHLRVLCVRMNTMKHHGRDGCSVNWNMTRFRTSSSKSLNSRLSSVIPSSFSANSRAWAPEEKNMRIHQEGGRGGYNTPRLSRHVTFAEHILDSAALHCSTHVIYKKYVMPNPRCCWPPEHPRLSRISR